MLFGVPGAYTPGCSKVRVVLAVQAAGELCGANRPRTPSTPVQSTCAMPSPAAVQTHLPGYVSDAEKLKEAGAEVVACVR